jgi:hypothetical protein
MKIVVIAIALMLAGCMRWELHSLDSGVITPTGIYYKLPDHCEEMAQSLTRKDGKVYFCSLRDDK